MKVDKDEIPYPILRMPNFEEVGPNVSVLESRTSWQRFEDYWWFNQHELFE